MKFCSTLWLSLGLLLTPLRAASFDAAQSTNALGLDLYWQLCADQKPGNLVISPYSIQSALALAYSGAEGQTRSEMAQVLRLPSGNDTLAAGFARIRESLARTISRSREMAAGVQSEGETSPIELYSASRIYGQRGYAFREAHLSFLRDQLFAPFEAVDFQSDAEAVRGQINQWIAAQTRNRIKDMIGHGELSPASRTVLVNAVYFKAAWMKPFQSKRTTPRPFHLSDGSTREVPMMEQLAFMRHARENRSTVVALDYIGGHLQFLIIVPDAGTSLSETTAALSAAHFARWAKLRTTEVLLQLPKFRLPGQTCSLNDALIALGLNRGFDRPTGSADFDRLAPRTAGGSLALSNVLHQTFIAVDEKGTEAAAATTIAMIMGAGPNEKKAIPIRVDRPFLFAIQEVRTGVCLFLGRIDDPRW